MNFLQVANVSVRNVGTVGGNLMLKHSHKEFPSDVFVLFEAVGARLTVKDVGGAEQTMLPSEWIASSMEKKVLVTISLPPVTGGGIFRYTRLLVLKILHSL